MGFFQGPCDSEFFPKDYALISRARFRKPIQSSSASVYLSDFWNLTLKIPGISKGEKLDRSIQGLKYEGRLEVRKSCLSKFEETGG